MLLSMMLYSFTILLFNPFSITFFRAYFKDKLTPDSNRNISVFILISTVLITAFTYH
jgi:threonine/homoserine/homoserine lactone efflux protein